ncbi:uncharacterized protein BJ171DRAFT_505534 [Polychytrium aggregatum]|uniref:uncharacterized protein n=1 Tax=Polychytrium aggregatum TaxID=110093 RepID=UPI0022FECF11|nr:uncharacterized protein BJ171DRAFT_505534 [Polychytrium aggregatum]KAI9204345.1 hypothetical protein BJ171DRAFT_505534 [Polychytrium aggregatum]
MLSLASLAVVVLASRLALGQPPGPGPECQLVGTTGPCRASIESFYFDPEQGCVSYIWGGCGSERIFASKLDCLKSCAPELIKCSDNPCSANESCSYDETLNCFVWPCPKYSCHKKA